MAEWRGRESPDEGEFAIRNQVPDGRIVLSQEPGTVEYLALDVRAGQFPVNRRHSWQVQERPDTERSRLHVKSDGRVGGQLGE
jgi:hypothetical protein